MDQNLCLLINSMEIQKQRTRFNFCFPDEASFANWSLSWFASPVAQVFGEKLNKYITPVKTALNTPAWFKNDWTPDQVFMIWEMEVSDPGKYVKEFASFSQEMAVTQGYEENSYGLGYPISGKNGGFLILCGLVHLI